MSPKRTASIEAPQLPFLDRYERIDTLSRVEGFMPTTAGELTEVMGLAAFDSRLGGAAKHLAEVILKQNKARTDDPKRAARKIVRNYINYAEDAQRSSLELTELQTVLSTVFNPELVLDRVVEPSQPGLLPFLRFFDLSTLRDTHDMYRIGYDPMKTDYSKDNPGIMHYVGEAMTAWRVQQVRTNLPMAIEDQDARLGFFEDRLGEVAKHFPYLKPIAAEGLEKLHQSSGE